MKKFLLMLAVVVSHGAPAQGVTAERVLLGQSVALTGPAAELGIQMRNGARAYFDHVNASGGVHGRRIELITLDDGYEPARTVPNPRRLIEEDRVFALFGHVGTPTSAAALNREKLIHALDKMRDVDLGGFYAGFSPKSHSASHFVDLTIIGRNGKFLR